MLMVKLIVIIYITKYSINTAFQRARSSIEEEFTLQNILLIQRLGKTYKAVVYNLHYKIFY